MGKIITAILSVLVFGLHTNSARADTAAAPPCLMAFGDIWGEESDAIPEREIDGKTIKTPTDLARMTGTREYGVKIIKGGDFSGWDFSKIPLSMICFQESKLAGANFSGASVPGVGFIKSDLTGANLRGADMRGVLFRNANLTNVSSQTANFSTGQFDGGWFDGGVEGWNIDGANMTGFTFECGITLPDGCPVYQGGDPISAKDTNFTKATLHSFGLFNMIVDEARLDETVIGPAQLSDLAKAEFAGNIIMRGGDSDIFITPDEAKILMSENAKQQVIDDVPSFDCTKAKGTVENEICGEYAGGLRSFDRDVAALYKQARMTDGRVRTSQRIWLKNRNACADKEYPSDCIRESYSQRKGELLGLLGENIAWDKNGEAVFFEETLAITDIFQETELFAKLKPVFAGASRSEVFLKRNADGSVDANGEAVGANAHTCGLWAKGTRFNAATGWYSIVTEKDGVKKNLPVFRHFDGRLEIYRNGHPRFDDSDDGLIDYVSCGVRASFPELHQIKFLAEDMAKYRRGEEEL